MNAKSKLHVTFTRRDNRIHVSVKNAGVPLSSEEHIQLQILEYEMTNTDHFHGMVGTKELWL
jgi:hypothetical protein